MKKTIKLGAIVSSFMLFGSTVSVLGYTVTIHNRDWRTHTLKIDVTGGPDKHPEIKPGETVEVGVGGYCTRAVEIESPSSRKGRRIENPGGNCSSWTVWITRSDKGDEYLDAR